MTKKQKGPSELEYQLASVIHRSSIGTVIESATINAVTRVMVELDIADLVILKERLKDVVSAVIDLVPYSIEQLRETRQGEDDNVR